MVEVLQIAANTLQAGDELTYGAVPLRRVSAVNVAEDGRVRVVVEGSGTPELLFECGATVAAVRPLPSPQRVVA